MPDTRRYCCLSADGRVSRLVLDEDGDDDDDMDDDIRTLRNAITTPDTHRDIDRLRSAYDLLTVQPIRV